MAEKKDYGISFPLIGEKITAGQIKRDIESLKMAIEALNKDLKR